MGGAIQVLALLALVTLIKGHGNMVRPIIWSDTERKGWFFDEDGNDNKIGCDMMDIPDDFDFSEYWPADGYGDPDCMVRWFNDAVEIPGSRTVPDELSQPEVKCVGQAGADIEMQMKFPWSAPGSAPLFSPCGAMGGRPNGCMNDGIGYFGQCCDDQYSGYSCATNAMGYLAEEVDWPNPAVTEWKAGSLQEVVMYIRGNHGGGYAYRLCKVPEGGITDLTEECFQNGHLDFFGDKQFVEYDTDKVTGIKTEVTAKRSTEGTFPSGSMWTALPFYPKYEADSDEAYADGHIIDKVVVPSSLEPGDYILSSRYDSKCTAQVYNTCSNIRITN